MMVYEKKDLAGPLISPTKKRSFYTSQNLGGVWESEREVQDFGEKSKVTKTHHHWHHRNETQEILFRTKTAFFHCCCGMNKVSKVCSGTFPKYPALVFIRP